MELPLAQVLARVESHGHPRRQRITCASWARSWPVSIAALEREIHQLAGTTFNIGSPKQLAEVLFGKLGLPVIRRTKTGPSTDADVLEELAALHPVPAKIVEYRGLTKLKGTYIDALPALVHPRTGRLHTTFNQAVAATGRLSSSDPNLQNIPIRTEVGRRIRAGLRRRPRLPDRLGRLLADRAAHPGALLRGPGLPGRLPQRRRTSTSAPPPRCSACRRTR